MYMYDGSCFIEYVTRYEKRDRSGFFVDSAFWVCIVSSMSIEFNGTSLKENITQKPSYNSFFLPGSPVAMKQFYEKWAILFYFPFCPYTSMYRMTSRHNN